MAEDKFGYDEYGNYLVPSFYVPGGVKSSGQSVTQDAPKTTTNPVVFASDPPKTAVSPTYDLNISGNLARIGDPIPVQYGQCQCYPDLVAKQIKEVSPTQSIYYYLFCIGQGAYQIDSIKIGDTAIADVAGVTYEVLQPGQAVTLYPTVLVTGPVDNIHVTDTVTSGYICNNSETTITAFDIDWVFNRGLYKKETDGSVSARSVSATVEFRAIDDNGDPTGSWTLKATETFTDTISAPLNKTTSYTITAGRYEIRVRRTTTESTDPNIVDSLYWVRLRSRKASHPNYGNVTLLAIKSVAVQKPFDLKDTRVSVVSTRKIPTWNGSVWSADTATASIMWACADVVKAAYGPALTDSYIDLAAMLTLNITLTARGDSFNGRFERQLSVDDALASIAAAGRCQHFFRDGKIRFIRDQISTTYAALFCPANIVKGSLSVEYKPRGYAAPQAIIMEYTDTTTWKTGEVTCGALSPTITDRQTFFGCNSREHAYHEGMYRWANDLYRRTFVNLSTGFEGHIPTIGDVVIIADDKFLWGQWGEVFSSSLGTLAILSNPVNFGIATSGYIYFSTATGGVSGPHTCTPGASSYEVIVASGLPTINAIGGGDDKTKTTYAFATALSSFMRCRVIEFPSSDGDSVSISCIKEDDRVHTADTGSVPAAASSGWDTPPEHEITAIDETSSNLFFGGLTIQIYPGWNQVLIVSWVSGGYTSFGLRFSYDGTTWSNEIITTQNFYHEGGGNLAGVPHHVRVTPYLNGVAHQDKMVYWSYDVGSVVGQVSNTAGMTI